MELNIRGAYLEENDFLKQDYCLKSPAGGYYAIMQKDGNFVVYKGNVFTVENAQWSTHTEGKKGTSIQLHVGGILNMWDEDTKTLVWHSTPNKIGVGPYKLYMQDDGNLVIYDKNGLATWHRFNEKP